MTPENKNISQEVSAAVCMIRSAILQSQERAIKAVNQEQLALYFGIGRFISSNTRNKNWGTGVIEGISNQLKDEFPGIKGYSVSSLKNMRLFYEAWKELEVNSPIGIGELAADARKNSDKYLQSVDIEHHAIRQLQLANYPDFPIVEFLSKGFTFVGNQVHFDKFGHDHWIDLLFYNRDLRRTVVFELKKGKFKVGYLAQLSSYLRILNDDDRREGEFPPIGIILCKGMDKEYVNYIMQDFLQPMGVATYKTADEVDPDIIKYLPPKEELMKLIDNDKEDEV